MTTDGSVERRLAHAEPWARTVLQVLTTPYP
jgi:hypothetical protein